MAGNTIISDDEDEVEYEPPQQQPEDEEEEMEDVEADEAGGPVDGEAVEAEEQDGDDEDEEDEEGPDEFEKDGFIVDDIDEEEEDEDEVNRADSDEERQKRKRKKKRESEKNFVLDEDDYELLQDNNITGFHRPKPESKKFKRLKKAQRDTEEERFGFSDEEEFDGSGNSGRTAEEKLKRSLFGDDEGPQLEDIAEEEELPEEEDVDMADDDEMADFIVDEEEVDENGAVLRRRKVNKKKSRQAPGVSSSALQEAHDIFGDVDELLRLRKQGLAKISRYDDVGDGKERTIEDEFEPAVLSEKYMTEKDQIIRGIDIPERIQLSEESTGSPPKDEISLEMSLEEESNWIYDQLFTGTSLLSATSHKVTEMSVNKDDIRRFLKLRHGPNKLEVPFIAAYRKEDCLSLLTGPEQYEDNKNRSDSKPRVRWHKILWAVQDLDTKWLLLQKRKNGLESYYHKRFEEESRRVYDETRLKLNEQLFESISRSLKAAESEKEVEDVDMKFNLHFPPGEIGADDGQYKRPKRKSQYSICSKAGLWEVASKFGYSSEQFGLQISLEKMRMEELEDPKETPEEMASNFTCTMFDSPQNVLKGARHMAAVEISCEPCVRKHVRSIFIDNAVVTTTPTPAGNSAIDSYHQFAGVKWLRNKPLTRFDDVQWLLIQKAEEEKLLQVTIKLPEAVMTKLIADSHEYYLSDGVSKSAQLWNEQRKTILHDAFNGFLLPSMEKEARSLLSCRAKNWLLNEYGKTLWEKVSVAPYQRKDKDPSSEDDTTPRVMACCWGPGKPPTTFVMLDSSGEVVDTLDVGFLSSRSQNSHDQQRKKVDQDRLLKFLTDHQPTVVALGAVNLSCTRLKDDIYEVIFKIMEENPRDIGHEMDNLKFFYGDDTLPHLYENSRVSLDQLPGHSGIVRRAVALGRYMQNPLAMVATLCGPGKEILSWKLNPLESFLTSDEKYGMIEQVMVDVTNQVGFDVNLAKAHEWLFGPLQFISGLGPRKAAHLQRCLLRVDALYSRKDLLRDPYDFGKTVFVNASGFLRIRRTGFAATSSQYIDLLDDTRIHPESYSLAQELAKDVYDADVQDDANDDDDDIAELAIEHVREKPELLRSFKVDEYAKSKGKDNKRETLECIRLELIQGFLDCRRPFVEPTPDDDFYMISGETEDTLCEGRVVQVTVRRVQPQKAICGLESGLTGFLSREDFTDDWRDNTDLTEKIQEGDILTCRIKSIQKNRFHVFLTCRDDEMRNSRYEKNKKKDPFYHEDLNNSHNEHEKARKEKELAKKHFKSRMIVHPRFQNITADEAVEFLSDKEPGESIVRPSSRGPSYLTLTLKIYDGVYAHKDIVEGGKEHKDITSMLRIGKTLKLGEDTFEDLDEVMDRYVDPLVSHLKTMLSYRKFKHGSKAEVDEMLRIEKSENPMRIVYCFGISHEHPGTFILTYIRNTNPHHEYVGLYPKGFKFRRRMFEDIDRLVAYFQRHIDDPQQDPGPSIRSVAAMVPIRSPAPGGPSGWGKDGGGSGHPMDRDRHRSGRSDYRNGGNRDGHPSGAPRPHGGRGRGRPYNSGRGSSSSGRDDRHGFQRSGSKDPAGLSNFPGAKVHNSPGRESFPGGWGSGWS